jgi:hypothetical protein
MGLYSSIQFGEVEIATDLDDSQKQMLSKNLNSIFWIIMIRKTRL